MTKRRRPTDVDAGTSVPASPRPPRAGRKPPGSDDTPSAPPAAQPSRDDIRVRAYERYLERGGGHGLDFEDWIEAERELKQKR